MVGSGGGSAWRPCVNDGGEAAENDRDSILRGAPWLLHYVSKDKNGLRRDWYERAVNRPNDCDHSEPDGLQCDEYPFYSTNEAGPANPLNPIGPGLRRVPRAENGLEGNTVYSMVRHCGLTSGQRLSPPDQGVLGSPYLVVPVPDPKLVPRSTYICGNK